jgi:hypothetical protein
VLAVLDVVDVEADVVGGPAGAKASLCVERLSDEV